MLLCVHFKLNQNLCFILITFLFMATKFPIWFRLQFNFKFPFNFENNDDFVCATKLNDIKEQKVKLEFGRIKN